MREVNVTELRSHLPAYLCNVQAGEELVVTSHGKATLLASCRRTMSEKMPGNN